MNKLILTAAVASILPLSACATDPYGYNNDPYRSSQGSRAATGAVVGAVVGGVAGAVIPGVSTVEGAIAGGVAGAVIGAVVRGKQYYRDTRGSCYYVDQYGRPVYDYDTRC